MTLPKIRATAVLGSAIVVAGLLSGCGKASSPTRGIPSPSAQTKGAPVTWNQPPGKPAGEQVAQQLVAAAVVPPGAQRLKASPSRSLDGPFTTVADDNLIDRNAWWKVNLSADDLLAYLQSHPPARFVSSGSAGSESGPGQPTIRSLTLYPPGPSAAQQSLQLTFVAAGDRTSWLRVDGQAIWYPARPAAETAPTQGSLTISLSNGPTRKVSDAEVVRRLATEFNALIRTTPAKSGGVNCAPNERTLSIAFAITGALHPTVVATEGACSSSWSVRGPSGGLPALDGGTDLLTDALELLGLPPNAL